MPACQALAKPPQSSTCATSPGGSRQASAACVCARVGQAHGADAPVAPGLRAQPGAGVEPVLAVRQVFDEAAFGAVAAAGVLVDHGVAVRGEARRDLGARGRGAVGRGDLAAAGQVAAVGRALHDHRERAGAVGQVDVGGQADAVAHRDHVGGGHRGLRCGPDRVEQTWGCGQAGPRRHPMVTPRANAAIIVRRANDRGNRSMPRAVTFAAGLVAALAVAVPGAAIAQPPPAGGLVTPQPDPDAAVAPYVVNPAAPPHESRAALIRLLRNKIKYVFVIFNENHSFDNEFGTFPGADGLYSDGHAPRDAAHTPGFTPDLHRRRRAKSHGRAVPHRAGAERHLRRQRRPQPHRAGQEARRAARRRRHGRLRRRRIHPLRWHHPRLAHTLDLQARPA